MDPKLVALVAIGVIASVIGGSEAIKCYECQSKGSGKCFDPFSKSGVNICDGKVCRKVRGLEPGITASP